jgi:hypothetical protein
MDKVNSPVGWWLRAISWVPDDGALVQPSQNAVEPADFSFGDRVQVLGPRGAGQAVAGRRILPAVATRTASCDSATVVEAA